MPFFTKIDPPIVQIPVGNNLPILDNQSVPVPPVDPLTPSRKRPDRTLGLAGTSAAYLVPDFVRKKFVDGWSVHVPLTFLTDKGCLLRNKPVTSATQEILTIDNSTGRIQTTAKPLSDDGELDLTFDEWHQAWRRLLDLIRTFLSTEFLLWESHYYFILNRENRAELWPIYLAYDVEIRRRAVQTPIDPSVFSIGIWNDLEARYTAKRVLSMVQSDLKQQSTRGNQSNTRNSTNNTSFRNYPSSDNSKTGRCIFCGERPVPGTKSHLSRNCTTSCYANGTPTHLYRVEPSGTRQSKSGKRYCYAWNGPSGCEKGPTCHRGEHCCTLCGSTTHNAQKCDAVA